MPPKKSCISKKTKRSVLLRSQREHETPEEREDRLESQRLRASTSRAAETSNQHNQRLEAQRILTATSRMAETPEEREFRLENDRTRVLMSRSSESTDQRESRLRSQRIRTSTARATENSDETQRRLRNERSRSLISRENESFEQREVRREQNRNRNRSTSFERMAYEYTSEVDYSSDELVAIGRMTNVCRYCNALKFKNEAPGMCCSNGKVFLPELLPPPEPLLSLMTGKNTYYFILI